MPATRPAMAFFLFVDIVDSTSYRDWKGPMPDGSDPEDSPFTAMILRFYRHMREAMLAEWDAACAMSPSPIANAPRVVKSMGDAMLFRIDPRTPACLAAAVLASARGLARFNREEVASGTRMKASGTAWIAMTPSPNRSISTSLVTGRAASGEFADDCIGPAMELGFRSIPSARENRMAITPDLAWMLLNDGVCRGLVESGQIALDRAEPRPLKAMLTGMMVPDVGVLVEAGALSASASRNPSKGADAANIPAIHAELTAFMTAATTSTWLTWPRIS